MSFDLALSGINAANTDLNVTSNNLANVDTTGFKESRAEFADLFAQTQGVAQTAVGNGVQVAEIAQQFGNGNTTNTGNNLDLALSGSGFFIVSDNGALNYTRDGAFQVDQNGYLVTASGEQVQGYAPLTNGGFNTGGLTSIQLNTAESAPQATTTAGVALNLPANATAPTNTPLNPADPTTYTDTTSMTVYDSLGAAHTAQLYFLKGATANAWTTQLYVDGSAVGSAQALDYSNTGVLTTPANGQVSFGAYTPTTGAAAMNITFNFGQSTQDGDAFGVTSVSPNGYTTGSLTGISIGSTGVVQANFTNGQSKNLGQIALANFANPQGLQQQGNNQWQQTFDSGDAVHGAAGGSGFAKIQSGELESSNVDITTQLVNMITAERDFQANAQMISATDQVTQSIINIPNG